MKRFSCKSTTSKDGSSPFLYNITNNRNIHTIKVQSYHLSSSRSSHKERTGGSEEYEALTSQVNISNCLIGYSTKRKSSYSYQILSAIKIQSVVRRYLLERKFFHEEINRQEDRNVMLKDIIQKYMSNYDYPSSNSELNRRHNEKVINELHMLIEAIKNPMTSPNVVLHILFIFFHCLSENQSIILLENLADFAVDVLDIQISKNDIISMPDSVLDLETKIMSMNEFGIWFIKYKSLHPFPILTKYQRFIKQFKDVEIPSYFMNKFIVIRTCLYDIIYSLNEFDLSRSPRFKCKICKKKIFTSFGDMYKHERECKHEMKHNKRHRDKTRSRMNK